MKKSGFCLIWVLLIGAVATTGWAAEVTGRIRGTVITQDGSVLPNVDLTATNVKTGVSYSSKSHGDGSYEILNLPIGDYKVTAQAPGFRTYNASGINLSINQVYVLPVKLQVGAVSETVDVVANAVQVDTTNMQLGTVVSAKQIVDLPLVGRDWTQLQLISPGTQQSSDRFGTYSTNGGQTQQNSFLINGTDINDLPLNTPIYVPSPDAIEQFNLVTSSLNPEYSRNSGAILSATIKNGANAFHGDVYDFFRDTFLNTHNYFQKAAPKFHRHEFGGTLGGPIYKNKLFFFLSYNGLRGVQPQSVGENHVYTPAQLTGDFSNDIGKFSSKPIPGTLSIPGCAAGTRWRTCLNATGGKIPGGPATFNPIAAAFVKQYVPLPNAGGNIFQFQPTTTNITDQGIARFDFNPSTSDQFWGLAVFHHRPSIEVLPFTGATLPGFGSTSQREVHQFTASWTHIFNPSTLNEFRLGYIRFNFGAVLPQKTVLPSSLGFAITPQATNYASAPKMSVAGFFTLGFSNNGPQPRLDQTRQVDDNFTKVVGRHSLKFGFQGRRFNVDNPFFASNSGSYTFSRSSSSIYSTGDASLDFLLGIPAGYNQGTGASINAYAYESYAYGQDVWKIRDNLTLTYGLGWQVDTALHNRQFGGVGVTCFIPGQQSKIFPTAPVGLDYPGDPGCNDASGSKTTWKEFAPRLGFAYSPDLGWISSGNTGKLVIRGGFGIYSNRTEEEGSLQNLQDPPFGFASLGAGDFGGRQRPAFQNPFQDINTGVVHPNRFPGVFPKPGDPVKFRPPFTQGLSQYAPGYRAPYSMNFNLTVQRELPSNIIATVSYVGALGRHNQYVFEGNPITQAGHDACLADPNCVADQDNHTLDFPSHTKYGVGNIFPSVSMIGTGSLSNYNSLQISAKKGYTHGLLFQTSYTWSHSLDDASSFEAAGFGGSGRRGYNQYYGPLNYGNSEFDARHRFVFSPNYDIPNWKGLPGMGWLPDVIGKGWKVNGILTLATGFPFDVSYSGNSSNSLYCSANFYFYTCPDAPNQVAPLKRIAPRASGPGKPALWFDNSNSAFVDPATGSFGNLSRNKFHGPGRINTDVSVQKSIYPWKNNENRYIQLRWEAYNLFNHTNFDNPNGDITSANFGRILSAKDGRIIQLAAKIYF